MNENDESRRRKGPPQNRRRQPTPRPRTRATNGQHATGTPNGTSRKRRTTGTVSAPGTRAQRPQRRANGARSGSRRASTYPRDAARRSVAPFRGRRRPRNAPGPRHLLRKLVALAVLGALITGSVAYAAIARSLPDPSKPLSGQQQNSVVYDRNGRVITELYADQNRTDVRFEQIPAYLRDAVISTEDKRFYEHKGVDPLGIARAVWVDVTQGKHHGGSTITQQLVVNTLVKREYNLTRKVKEAMLANRIEQRYTKDQIITMYLNTIYFGHGAYGVQAASQTYFGKDVQDLTLAECAMLGGIIKSPGRYSPRIDAVAAKNRRATVLGQMLSLGYITRTQHDSAEAEPFNLAKTKATASKAPYFMEWVKQFLVDKYGPDLVYRGGLRVRTTLDLTMQEAAEKAIAAELTRGDDPSAALVAIDPATGEVRAMVGGRDFSTQQYNVATQGHRQPGSAFKPFVLVSALEEGVSPEKTYDSSAAQLKLGNGQVWKVTGAHGTGGQMRLRTATEQSVNSVYAQLILDIGASRVAATAHQLGVGTPISAVPAIALGGLKTGVTPLEMASAYGTLADNGTHVAPHGIAKIEDADGKTLYTAPTAGKQVVSPAIAYLTTDILKGVIARGTGTAAALGRPAAGKTGTTQQYRDAWFVGYTPQLVASVWVGYPQAQTEMTSVHGIKVTGGSFPARIWARFMKAALQSSAPKDFVRPGGLVNATICLDSGQRATRFCPKTGTGLFLAGHVPGGCELHSTAQGAALPKLVGLTRSAAIAKLDELGIAHTVQERAVAGVTAGTVAEQTPAAGTRITAGMTVTLVISSGSPKDAAPVASFSVSPAAGRAGQPLSFDASGSTDDGTIVKYAWEFGDGSAVASGKTAKHTFTGSGRYTVTLWVTDDAGQASSATRVVVVR